MKNIYFANYSKLLGTSWLEFSEEKSKVKSYTQKDGTRVKSFWRKNKKKILAGVGVSALLGGAYLLKSKKKISLPTPVKGIITPSLSERVNIPITFKNP